MASPRIIEAKYFIISHVACKYTYIKNSSFSFIALLLMPRLSEHKRSGTIEILKAGICVSDVARYYNCHLSTIHSLRNRYQATGTVKDQYRSDQPRMATGWRGYLRQLCIDDIYINKSVAADYCQCQTKSMAPRVTCICFFNKNVLSQQLKFVSNF